MRMIHSSDVGFLDSGFKPPVTVASRIPHPHSIKDQTPRLIVKELFTARNSHQPSKSCKGQKKWRKEIEVPRRRNGRVQKGRDKKHRKQIAK